MNNKPLEDAVEALSKHYEVVVCLVCNHEAGTTEYATRGAGNHFARVAMCDNYVSDQENGKLASELNRRDDDGSDDWKEDS